MATSPTIINFDIRILPAEAGYQVTAQAPDSGLAQTLLDMDLLQAEAFQAKLRQVREEPFTTQQALFQEIGETLFRALFREDVYHLFFALYTQRVQAEEEVSLRLRLHIDARALAVAQLPWEFLYHQDVFLATQIRTLVTRQLLDLEYGPMEPLEVKGRPRVLIVIPQVANLDVSREEKAITQALETARIPYEVLKGRVTRQRLDEALAQKPYAMLHFIGHGAVEEDEQGQVRGRLRLNGPEDGPEGDEDWISEVELQSLLGNHQHLKLVTLNGCEVGEVAARTHGQGFFGVVPALLRAGVPAVVAMQYPIRDDVAILFAETFYRRLVSSRWAGHVDIAVTLARNACLLAFPDDRGFATPVLYLRAPDGVIFKMTAGAAEEDLPCREPSPPPEALLYRYRNIATTTLIDRYHLLSGRLQRIFTQIDALSTTPTGQEAWRLRRYERNRDKLERELDALAEVLRWRAFEHCQELGRLQARLAQKEEERDELEEAGVYISYDLKQDIFDLYERILTLKDTLREIEALFGG